jgi:C4-dicarboxylate-specific signal transduction histidine kinase
MAGEQIVIRPMARAVNIDLWRVPSAILRYVLGVIAVIAATTIQHFGDMHFAVTPSFVCAVMVSGWFGGMGPGLLATALSILALKYYFVPPTGTFVIDTAYIPSIALFSLIALFVTWLSAKARKAAMSLVHAHDQLDLKIRELEKSNESLQSEIAARTRAKEELDQLQSDLAHMNRVATMGQMSASIAHEVSQPITGALTNANVALRLLPADPPNTDVLRGAIERIVRDCNRAGDVLERVRALAKKAPTRQDIIDVNEAIGETMGLAQGEVVRRRVSVQASFAGDLPPVDGDRVQLQQVILNLIINAAEAMSAVPEGSRHLTISTGLTAAGEVLVAVQDSGPGIDPAHVDRIFGAFYTTKASGLGMGLSISRVIIEAHGGRLWATNAPPGALFQLTLPARQQSQS